MGAGCAHCDLAAVRICDNANEWPPCIFAERRPDYEAMRGLERTGALASLDAAGIAAQPLPGAPPLQYHMLFSRDPRGSVLRQLVDEELGRLQQNGELLRLQQKFLPKVP
ncbi:MAG TPA: hypothetical protein VK195_21395 [Burkholderiaceae bacterium]|nr:hypothetical protein [Burkholderiaceae bacterium]